MRIDPVKYYSLLELSRKRAIPWIKNFRTLRKLIKNDVENNRNRVFRALVTGTGQGKRYLVKGEHIIQFVRKVRATGLIE